MLLLYATEIRFKSITIIGKNEFKEIHKLDKLFLDLSENTKEQIILNYGRNLIEKLIEMSNSFVDTRYPELKDPNEKLMKIDIE